MMKQKGSINHKLRIWGAPEVWSYIRISYEKQNSSTFRWNGVSSADVMWFVMKDRALHICQSQFAIRQSRWYSSTYGSGWDTASLFGQIGSFSTHMIEVQVHQRILGITSWEIQPCVSANPIWQSKQTTCYWVLMTEYEIWAHLFVAKPQPMLAYHWSSSTHLICTLVSRTLRCSSGILGSNPDFTAGVFLAYNSRLCTTEIFNPVQNELLRYVWSQLWKAASHYGCYHSSPATPQQWQISHRSTCTCSTLCTLYIFVHFILIMFSSTLN